MATGSSKKMLTDLLVIVVGVLIALFAENEWNAFQAGRVAEGYVDRLTTELEANRSTLGLEAEWIAHTCEAADALLAQLRAGEVDIDSDSLLHLAVAAIVQKDDRYQRATFDDLLETGSLALLGTTGLREQVVGTYTSVEAIKTWRPSIDSSYRRAVVGNLPRDFIGRVGAECVLTEDGLHFRDGMGGCEVEPTAASAEALLSGLLAVPGFTEDLSERAWTVCRFQGRLDELAIEFDSLFLLLTQESD
jgi:hypothetical protein